ncbi:proton-conducting membrane transporter [Halalkalicoccus tibetensis]|uniref:Proton-conducting membrane transporter n=1 Tax=Halalkalicoccus tibetensis TaxID=175632 RepID=A0ABD5V5S8_9EURY
MPTKPKLQLGSHLLPGLGAVALFCVLAFVFVTSSFPAPQGFPADANITANIGYALFNIEAGEVPAEGFIVAFFAIAIVLDAALDGSVMLARNDDEERDRELVPERGGFEGGEE